MNRLHPNIKTTFILAAVLAAFLFAQQERPDLWTPERKARADRAVGLVAKGEIK